MKFYLQGFHTLAQGLSSHSKDLRAFIFGWLVLVLWFHLSTRYRKLLYFHTTARDSCKYGYFCNILNLAELAYLREFNTEVTHRISQIRSYMGIFHHL